MQFLRYMHPCLCKLTIFQCTGMEKPKLRLKDGYTRHANKKLVLATVIYVCVCMYVWPTVCCNYMYNIHAHRQTERRADKRRISLFVMYILSQRCMNTRVHINTYKEYFFYHWSKEKKRFFISYKQQCSSSLSIFYPLCIKAYPLRIKVYPLRITFYPLETALLLKLVLLKKTKILTHTYYIHTPKRLGQSGIYIRMHTTSSKNIFCLIMNTQKNALSCMNNGVLHSRHSQKAQDGFHAGSQTLANSLSLSLSHMRAPSSSHQQTLASSSRFWPAE